MTKMLKLFVLVAVITLPLGGCFKSPEEKVAEQIAEQASQDMAGSLAEMEELANEMQEFNVENAEDLEDLNEEDLANDLEAMMEFSAKMELQEFEKKESLDVPADFPRELVYPDSKVISVNNSSVDDINLDVDMQTADDPDEVKEFYKNYLNDNDDWQVSRENIETGYYLIKGSYESDDIDKDLEVTVYYNEYSTLVDINVYYSEFSY